MNYFKRINLLVLMSFFVSSVSMAVSFDDVIGLLKSIYTLEYLNGAKSEHRNSSLFTKITAHPDRALMTVAVYGLTAFALKKLFDAADKAGAFDEVPARAPRPARPQDRQPNRPQPNNRPNNPFERPHFAPAQHRQDRQPNNQPDRQNRHQNRQQPNRPERQQRPARPVDRHNNVPVANPFNGHQLNLLGLNLPGFFHMESHTPYDAVRNSCGVHAAYNMARVEAQVFGRAMNNGAFDEALRGVYPQLGGRGMSDRQVRALAQRLELSRMTLIIGPQDARKIAARATEFNRGNGAQVTHFLCQVPGHWIAMTVARNAHGEQALYLYDNMNNHARSIQQMRQLVEVIYNNFF